MLGRGPSCAVHQTKAYLPPNFITGGMERGFCITPASLLVLGNRSKPSQSGCIPVFLFDSSDKGESSQGGAALGVALGTAVHGASLLSSRIRAHFHVH